MEFNITVFAKDPLVEGFWIKKLTETASTIVGVNVSGASTLSDLSHMGQIAFVDLNHDRLDEVLASIPREGRAVFLMANEISKAPKALTDGRADDILVHPFRPLEFLSKLYRYQQILMWDEVKKLNASFSELIGRLQGDLLLAERMQKSRMEMRYPEIKGFKIANRYLAGMKSGGDYFDIAESPGKNQISMVLTDSSSYGLSSSVLSVLMRVAVKLSGDETRSSLETVKRLHEELLLTLGEKDQLSLFYGVISRKDYCLRYVNLGVSSVFYADPKGGFRLLPASGEPITVTTKGGLTAVEQEVVLQPEGRLALLSDGFVDVLGGAEGAAKFLTSMRDREAIDSLNEMVFKVKATFESEDDMPTQDCTAAVFDLDAKLLRLAK